MLANAEIELNDALVLNNLYPPAADGNGGGGAGGEHVGVGAALAHGNDGVAQNEQIGGDANGGAVGGAALNAQGGQHPAQGSNGQQLRGQHAGGQQAAERADAAMDIDMEQQMVPDGHNAAGWGGHDHEMQLVHAEAAADVGAAPLQMHTPPRAGGEGNIYNYINRTPEGWQLGRLGANGGAQLGLAPATSAGAAWQVLFLLVAR